MKLDTNRYFKSNISDRLIRTGTIGDGSCFFHSVLKAIYHDYSCAPKDDKIKIIKQVRKEISRSLTLDDFLLLSQGDLAKLKVDMCFDELSYDFFHSDDCPTIYKSIRKGISYETFEKLKTEAHCESKTIEEFCNNFIDTIHRNVSIRSSTIFKFISGLAKTSIQESYKKFKSDIRDDSYWADYTMFNLVADYFNINIHFLNESGDVIQGATVIYPNRKNVIILNLYNTHFESIGYKEYGSPHSGVITRLFHPDHAIMKKINPLRRERGT